VSKTWNNHLPNWNIEAAYVHRELENNIMNDLAGVSKISNNASMKELSAKEMLKESARSRKTASIANQDKILSLHNRWGHPSIEKMKRG
jgi:hypothetical protein